MGDTRALAAHSATVARAVALSVSRYPRVASAGAASVLALVALLALPHADSNLPVNWLPSAPSTWLSNSSGLHWLPLARPAVAAVAAGSQAPPRLADAMSPVRPRLAGLTEAPAALAPAAAVPAALAPAALAPAALAPAALAPAALAPVAAVVEPVTSGLAGARSAAAAVTVRAAAGSVPRPAAGGEPGHARGEGSSEPGSRRS